MRVEEKKRLTDNEAIFEVVFKMCMYLWSVAKSCMRKWQVE